ncbi:hypothetical protein [Mycolicibacterium sarraceniae]|uniref:hypothetical protein n=1 Tax=Mycolicibacterium sarraceniae TaxID=1534348 RepID=UPI0013D0D9E2|nr:hypothetical protein [Mycolicibacterium sarraceniae]
MGSESFAYRKPAGVVAAVAVSLSTMFAGAPVSAADPYDGDDGGSSYDGGGGNSGGGGVEEPSGGGMEEPSGGGMEEPSGGTHGEPGGGGSHDEPGGGGAEPGGGGAEPGGGGMSEVPGGGGMNEVPGGGSHDEPGGGGAEPGGGGMSEVPGGGGMNEVPGEGPGTGGGNGNPSEPTPQGPQAPQSDVKTASDSEATTTTTTTMTSEEFSSYESSVSSITSGSALTTGLSLSSPVSLWNSSWISYDRFYRPVFTNPYRTPLSVVYTFGGQPQVFTVPPLQRATVNVPNTGVYNFTAMTRPEPATPGAAPGPATNLSVGSFSGGGYEPAPGQAPPQPPAKLNTQRNVLVQVKFDRGASAPFRVKTLTDLGADPTVNGITKVLLDEEIPAWGQWSKTDTNEALFVINQTQTLPGVNPPGQEPLPGYNVKLTAAGQKTSWIDRNKTLLISVAVGAGVLALAAVAIMLVTRRRRTTP